MRGAICLLIFTFATARKEQDFDIFIDKTILEIKEELPVGPFELRDIYNNGTFRGYSYRNVDVDNWRTLKRNGPSQLVKNGKYVDARTYIELTDLSMSADVSDKLILHGDKHYHLKVILKNVQASAGYRLKVDDERPELTSIPAVKVSGIEVEGPQVVNNARVREISESLAIQLTIQIFHALLPKIGKGVDIPTL